MSLNARLIFRSSLLIAAFFGVNKVVALARSIIIARVFGISPLLDAFNIANNLPDLLFALISGGALAIAFIPVMVTTLDEQGRDAGWELFSLVGNLMFIVTAVLALVVAIFAEPIVTAEIGIAPGFSPEQQALVIQLMRLNLIATLIFSLSGIVLGGLQAHNHFLLTVLAPIVYNLGQIFGALVLAPAEFPFFGLPIPTLNLGVYGLVYGVILGALLHLGIQLPGLWIYGFRWTPRLSIRHPGVWQVITLMAPRMVALAAFQYSELFRDNLASRLTEGSVTALSLGWFIQQVPQTLIGTAIATAMLPTLSMLAASADRSALNRTLTAAIRALLVLTLPATVISWLLVRPAVRLVFEGGAFLPEDTPLVVFATQMYLVGLAGHSLLEIASRTFYARKDALRPTVMAVFGMALQIGLALWLFRLPQLGFSGLALANSIAYTVQAVGLLVWLAVQFAGFDWRSVLLAALQTALASAAMGLATWGVLAILPADALILQLVLGGLAGGVAFLLVAALLRLNEVYQLPAIVRLVLSRTIPAPALDADSAAD